MPEPASAFSVRRESKTVGKETCSSTSGGMPSRPMVWSSSELRRARVRSSALQQADRAQGAREQRGRQHAGDAAVDRRRELRAPWRPRRTC